MSQFDYESHDTPAGMSPSEHGSYLVYHPGHPHADELNDPVKYGESKPDISDDPVAFKTWYDTRARTHHDTGSPLDQA